MIADVLFALILACAFCGNAAHSRLNTHNWIQIPTLSTIVLN